jgi:hypothetical protein
MKRNLTAAIATFAFSAVAFAGSWYFNQNGGFGIYQPDGWTLQEEGRSATLAGPSRDADQSSIFIGSDWNLKTNSLEDLRARLQKDNPVAVIEPVTVSDLEGFRVGTETHGELHILREPTNIIVVEYDLKGSSDQISEGQEALSSIEIRTGGIEYP